MEDRISDASGNAKTSRRLRARRGVVPAREGLCCGGWRRPGIPGGAVERAPVACPGVRKREGGRSGRGVLFLAVGLNSGWIHRRRPETSGGALERDQVGGPAPAEPW